MLLIMVELTCEREEVADYYVASRPTSSSMQQALILKRTYVLEYVRIPDDANGNPIPAKAEARGRMSKKMLIAGESSLLLPENDDTVRKRLLLIPWWSPC